jgi:enamine deaminase RidA (YjgF/YER057c/UK114 family)
MGRSICSVRIRWCCSEFGGIAGGGRGIVGLMSVELIRASRLADAVPYAYASVVPADARLVHTAGACPIDEHDRVVALGDVAGQARQVMDNLEVALQAAGAVLTDVVRTTVYVASADQADLVTAWNVVRARFGDHDAPSTLLGVTTLGYKGQLVEVAAVAISGMILRR